MTVRRTTTLAGAIAGAIAACATVAVASGGLDTSFGRDGVARIDAGKDAEPVNLATQPDGKLLVYARSPSHAAVVSRLDASGLLDASFGGDGTARIARASVDANNAVVVQPDGRILLTGRSRAGDAYDAAVFRIDAGGRLDPSFDGDGERILERGGFGSSRALALQPDGRILVGGSAGRRGTVAVHRLGPDGAPDPTFGQNGRALLGGEDDAAETVVSSPDGRIVVMSHDGVLHRLNADGTADRTFDGDGTRSFEIDEAPDAMVVLPDGRIVVAGHPTPDGDVVLRRFAADGALDPTFGRGGSAAVNLDSGFELRALTPHRDGGILIAGTNFGPGGRVHLLRSDGTPEAGGDRRIDAELFPTTAIAPQADGRILLAGTDVDATAIVRTGTIGAGTAPTHAAATASDEVGPSILDPALTPRRVRAGRGTRLRLALTEPADVTLDIDRALPGRATGNSDCAPPARLPRGRRCTRYMDVETKWLNDLRAGRHTIRFGARLRRRTPVAGRYRVEVGATDAAGHLKWADMTLTIAPRRR